VYSTKPTPFGRILIAVGAVVIAAFLFHIGYKIVTGLNYPELPVDDAVPRPRFTETISPDGSYRVRLQGGTSARVQLSVFPTTGSIHDAEIAQYLVLDTNWDAKVYYVWRTPKDLVVYCPLCTPIRVARTRSRLGDLQIEFKFPPSTVDDSTAVIDVPPALPRDEQKEYLDKVHRIREEHTYHFERFLHESENSR
jgi:hypothetical protein